jgi:hypothetical protein
MFSVYTSFWKSSTSTIVSGTQLVIKGGNGCVAAITTHTEKKTDDESLHFVCGFKMLLLVMQNGSRLYTFW